MDRVTAGQGGVAPHLISPDVDMSGFSEDDLRFLVLRSRLHTGEMPMQLIQGGQPLLGADVSALSRPSAQLAPGIPGTAGFAAPGAAGLVGPTREMAHPSPGPLLLGTNGMQSQQVAQTLAVPSGVLFDNYKALSDLGAVPLKPGLLQQTGAVEQTTPVGRGSPDSTDLQTPDSEEQVLRTQKKREKNRIAQQRFRLRQKKLVSDLQDELSKKSREIEDLKQTKVQAEEENKVLRKALERLEVDVDKVLQSSNASLQHPPEEPQVPAALVKQEEQICPSKEDNTMSREPIDPMDPIQVQEPDNDAEEL